MEGDLMVRLHLALVCVLIALAPAATAAAPFHGVRLRPQSPRIKAWLARGFDRSATMRELVDRIEQADVVVYLEIERTLGPGVAACVTWMASTPGVRYVRVSVRPDLRTADAVAMLAHELQHVVEVIEHPDVRSDDDLAALYQRIGHRTGRTGRAWDTVAALRAGDLARTEVVSGA
jgi:hypothetical protein